MACRAVAGCWSVMLLFANRSHQKAPLHYALGAQERQRRWAARLPTHRRKSPVPLEATSLHGNRLDRTSLDTSAGLRALVWIDHGLVANHFDRLNRTNVNAGFAADTNVGIHYCRHHASPILSSRCGVTKGIEAPSQTIGGKTPPCGSAFFRDSAWRLARCVGQDRRGDG